MIWEKATNRPTTIRTTKMTVSTKRANLRTRKMTFINLSEWLESCPIQGGFFYADVPNRPLRNDGPTRL
ncbi:hypothetical protein AWM68_09865 [Fictibacillus phosphorivorans]|uniref:Uncharacterized protein n=1 Tax=Fictibacillus phosphorivorans TaxID=1221500 RepID=A0A163QD94_9BACL|nr:hypothetical protein AWM68_09865 [Fictibacillus phosphorivorans]